jgi:hypothetical protein
MTTAGPIPRPETFVRPPLTKPEKYERLAFTFCKMGTVGLMAWALTPRSSSSWWPRWRSPCTRDPSLSASRGAAASFAVPR